MAFLFFTGGIRSGKSRLAQTWAEQQSQERLYLATCLAQDAEMKARVEKHKKSRGPGWLLLEEPLDPQAALEVYLRQNPQFQGAILLDSLGMWINNLMAQNLSAPVILRKAGALASFFASLDRPAAIISEECGLGVIPINAVARKFVDLLGVVNQMTATEARTSVLAVCGIGLPLKGQQPPCLNHNDAQ